MFVIYKAVYLVQDSTKQDIKITQTFTKNNVRGLQVASSSSPRSCIEPIIRIKIAELTHFVVTDGCDIM